LINLVVALVLLVILGCIVFQDFKDREVSILLLGLMFFIIILRSYFYIDFIPLIENAAINLLLCGVMLCCTKIYFLFHDKRNNRMIDKYIGKGDLITLMILSFSSSCNNFILFLLLSFLLSLIHGLVLLFLIKKKHFTIPLAGYLTATYSLMIALDIFSPDFDFYIDDCILVIFS